MYKNFTIRSFPLQLPHIGQWKTNISISWERDGTTVSRPFSGEATFPTPEEAHVYGIEFGQRIIDQRFAKGFHRLTTFAA